MNGFSPSPRRLLVGAVRGERPLWIRWLRCETTVEQNSKATNRDGTDVTTLNGDTFTFFNHCLVSLSAIVRRV
jgi:hypothetical protein